MNCRVKRTYPKPIGGLVSKMIAPNVYWVATPNEVRDIETLLTEWQFKGNCKNGVNLKDIDINTIPKLILE